MKVSNKNLAGAANVESTKTKATDKNAAALKNEKPSSISDFSSSAKVNLSSRAQDIQKAKDVISKTPDVDEAKVARFQKLIDSGEYKTDAKAIADKLVDEHLIYRTDD